MHQLMCYLEFGVGGWRWAVGMGCLKGRRIWINIKWLIDQEQDNR